MSDQNEILDKIGRRDGMTVPEGYFESFATRMQAMLPDLPEAEHTPRKTFWLKVRPYVYLAAMFAGIYCMMEMFSIMRGNQNGLNIESYPTLTATLGNDTMEPEIIYDVDDYEIIEDMLNEGYSADDLFVTDTTFDTPETLLP